MPLSKWFRGRRVVDTKVRGDLILVKLARRSPQRRPEWIAVSLAEYKQGLIVQVLPPRRGKDPPN